MRHTAHGAESLLAERALATGDLEAGDYSIAFSNAFYLWTNVLDNAHPLVPQDVANLQLHDLLVVQMQITATDCCAGYLAERAIS